MEDLPFGGAAAPSNMPLPNAAAAIGSILISHQPMRVAAFAQTELAEQVRHVQPDRRLGHDERFGDQSSDSTSMRIASSVAAMSWSLSALWRVSRNNVRREPSPS